MLQFGWYHYCTLLPVWMLIKHRAAKKERLKTQTGEKWQIRGGGVNEGREGAGVYNRWSECGIGKKKEQRESEKETWSSPVWSSHLRCWHYQLGCMTQWCWGLSNWTDRSLSLRNTNTPRGQTWMIVKCKLFRQQLNNESLSSMFTEYQQGKDLQYAQSAIQTQHSGFFLLIASRTASCIRAENKLKWCHVEANRTAFSETSRSCTIRLGRLHLKYI